MIKFNPSEIRADNSDAGQFLKSAKSRQSHSSLLFEAGNSSAVRTESSVALSSTAVSFKRVYQQVANANRQSIGNDRQSSKSSVQENQAEASNVALQDPNRQIDNSDSVTGESSIESILASAVLPVSIEQLLGNQSGTGEVTDQLKQAFAMLKDSIGKISESLNLKIVKNIDAMQAMVPTDDVIAQFAEMVSVLKQIGQVLADAANQGIPLEINGMTFDTAQIATSQQVVSTGTFQIELAISSMGVAKQVAEKIAQNDGEAVGQSNVALAIDPQTKSMTDSQLRQIMGNSVTERPVDSKDVNVLMQQFVAAVNKQSEGKGQAKVTVNVSGVLAGDQNNVATRDVSSFDSVVMRRLLKIDGRSETESENNAAAKIGDLGLKGIQNGAVLSAISPDTIAQKLDPEIVAQIGQVIPGAQSAPSQVADARLAQLTPRTMEESVVKQLVGQFNCLIHNKTQEVRMTLRPESLGEVTVKIQVENNIVFTRIQVENQQVKQIVESNMQSLKDSLAEHNLQTGGFEVNIGFKDGNGNWEQFEEQIQANRNSSEESRGSIDALSVSDPAMILATETGKRYGSNSVEYFA